VGFWFVWVWGGKFGKSSSSPSRINVSFVLLTAFSYVVFAWNLFCPLFFVQLAERAPNLSGFGHQTERSFLAPPYPGIRDPSVSVVAFSIFSPVGI